MLSRADRKRFDALMERAIAALPPQLTQLIEQVPVIVLDRPTSAMLRSVGIDPADEDEILGMCGLHSGAAITERSVGQHAEMPEDIHLFREGIIDLAGGFGPSEAGAGAGPAEAVGERAGGDLAAGDEAVYDEIVITLLHEIGHHFGLDEDDLERLGYQ